MKKNILLGMIVFMLLVTGASAQIQVNKFTNEFAFSKESIGGKVCAGSGQTIPVTVDNVGDVKGVFELALSSPNNEFFTISESTFTLEAGEANTVYLRVDAPIDYTGTFDYALKASSTYGREKNLEGEVIVVRCQNLKIQEGVMRQFKNPAELATFNFTVKNPADFSDTYTVDVDKHAEYTTLSEQEFVLEAGEEKEVFVYAKFPAADWGDFKIPVTVSTVNNGQSKQVSLDLNIKRAYEFAVSIENEALACSKITTTMPVTIQNNAGVKNTYDLDFDGPGFAKLTKDELTLEPGESATVQLEMAPPDRQAGMYEGELTITSRLGDLETERDIAIEAANCFEHQVEMQEAVKMVCGEAELEVNVRNNGLYDEEFLLSKQGPVWAELDETVVRLAPNENKNVKLLLDAPCSDQEYDITVEAINKDLNHVKRQDSTTVHVVTPQTAYALMLPKKNFDIKYGDSELEVKVENTGFKQGTYKVMIDSHFLTPQEDEVTIPAGESRDIQFNIGNLSGFDEGEYLHELTLELVDMNATYTATIGTNLKGPAPFFVAWNWLVDTLIYSGWYATIGLCGWSTILLLLILIAVITVSVMIARERIKVKRFTVKYRPHFYAINLAFIAIAVLGLLFFFTSFSGDKADFYQEPAMNESPLFHQWRQGQEYRLDLASYYEDPDMDELTYSASSVENLDVYFEGSMAVIKPQPGWSGEEKIVFTAADEAGATKDSDVMTLRVLERKDISWVDAWLANCSEINALLIAFIFIMLLYPVDKVEPRGREFYFNKRK